jgi:hypothetical protein
MQVGCKGVKTGTESNIGMRVGLNTFMIRVYVYAQGCIEQRQWKMNHLNDQQSFSPKAG